MTDPRGASIFIVDDDQEILDAISDILEMEGFRVRSCSDPVTALALAHSESPDLLLTDVAMPGLTGPALVSALRSARDAVRVLFMSAYSVDDAIEEFGMPPDAPFLAKPFHRQVLVRAVAQALA